MPVAPKAASVSPSDDGMLRGSLESIGELTFGWDSKLRKTDEFSSVFRFKRVLRQHHLDIFFRQNGLAFSRLGLIVPKRVLARAVDRNRAKRVIREVFRLGQHELGGLDVVVKVKQGGTNADYRAEWSLFESSAASRSAVNRLTNG